MVYWYHKVFLLYKPEMGNGATKHGAANGRARPACEILAYFCILFSRAFFLYHLLPLRVTQPEPESAPDTQSCVTGNLGQTVVCGQAESFHHRQADAITLEFHMLWV